MGCFKRKNLNEVDLDESGKGGNHSDLIVFSPELVPD
jgi:hypothetical protein